MSLRVGVIGLGGIARKAFLPVLTSWEGLDLLLCSRNPAVVESLKAQYRVAHGAASLDELLELGTGSGLCAHPFSDPLRDR